jgi:uncharacterized tellurite resistance protein B-like protein
MSNVFQYSYSYGEQDNKDEAYTQALKAVEGMFMKQRARIVEQLEEALDSVEQNGFADHRTLARAAAHAQKESWEADEQVFALKRRLDELHRVRVVEPIMEIRRLSVEMEKRNRKHFRRRVGDLPH